MNDNTGEQHGFWQSELFIFLVEKRYTNKTIRLFYIKQEKLNSFFYYYNMSNMMWISEFWSSERKFYDIGKIVVDLIINIYIKHLFSNLCDWAEYFGRHDIGI